MESLIKDVRYALRLFRKRPGFSAVALVTLALGIGANSAIFSVVNAIVLRPLPYRNSKDLIVLRGNLNRPGLEAIEMSAPEFTDIKTQSSSFEQVAAFDDEGFNLTGGDRPERIWGARVSANLFPALSVAPQLGRIFSDSEDQFQHDSVIIISDSLWHRRFGGDSFILNQPIRLDGETVTIAGVMPASFHFPDKETEIWRPLPFDPDLLTENNRGSHFLNVIARLKSGVTAEQAQADVTAIAARLSLEHKNVYPRGFGASVRSLHDDMVGDLRKALLILLGAVGLVLAVACANVAHLLLANAAARYREIAVRTALGASRTRVIRQFLTESIVLSVSGGVLGLALAIWGVRLLVALIPKDTPRLEEISLDYRVVFFTLGISLVTGLIFGLVPAFQSSKPELNETLKEGGRGGAEGRRRLQLRNFLAVSEVALALVLLIGAGLLIKSFRRLQEVRPGFEPSQLFTMRVALTNSKYSDFQKSRAFFEQLFDRFKARSEIQSVGAINSLPFGGGGGDRGFTIEDQPIAVGEPHPDEQIRFISAGYFNAMAIPMLRGRDFTFRDLPDTPQVAVINQAMAKKYWPNQEPMGKRLSFSQRSPKWYEVVGVVGNVKHRSLDLEDKPEIYLSFLQPLFVDSNIPPMYVVTRTTVDPMSISNVVRSEVAALDPDQPVANMLKMDQRISDSVAARRFNVFLLGLFAGLALTLSAVGIYGIMAFSVSQRTHEIGVRMALGARQRDVMTMVLKSGLGLTLVGISIGLLISYVATRLMSSLLFEVSATDPTTFLIDSVLLALIGFVACYIPAHRATRVDPLVALRYE